jgi:hypothetical protein
MLVSPKTLLILLFISISRIAFCDPGDLKIKANWHKGEKKLLEIIHRKINLKNGLKSSGAVSFKIEVTILDSNQSGYLIQWKYKEVKLLLENNQKVDPLTKEMAELVNGLNVNFRTTADGAYIKIENSREIIHFLDFVLNKFISRDSAAGMDSKRLRMIKSIVMNTLGDTNKLLLNFKEIAGYYSLFGADLENTDSTISFGGHFLSLFEDTLKCKFKAVYSINSSNKTYNIQVFSIVNQEAVTELIKGQALKLARMNGDSNYTIPPEFSCKMTQNSDYEFDNQSFWIRKYKLEFIKSVTQNNSKTEETEIFDIRILD